MFMDSPIVEQLIASFRRLPGVGRKSAERYALHVLTMEQESVVEFSEVLREARRRIGRCAICGNLTDANPCAVCTDDRRDRTTICVVEQPSAVIAIERGGEYRGVYHVLHGVLNPLDGMGPEELHLDALEKRIDSGNVAEVIVATNTTAEGEATAIYLSRRLGACGVRVSRIAHGVPMGGGVEYADAATLGRALAGRSVI